MKETQQSEALARAILGIFRYRAIREAFSISSTNYKTLLCFNLAESLPGGDLILETLSSRLSLISGSSARFDVMRSPNSKKQVVPAAFFTLCRLGIAHSINADIKGEVTNYEGDVYVGESNPLKIVVKQLKQDTGRAEAAQATVDQVKVEGIDTNLAVMKELLFPVTETLIRLQKLASWENPCKSVIFVLVSCYLIQRHTMKWRQRDAFKIIAPPGKNAVEQLLILQEFISQVESLIQSGNVILLKFRALLFAVAPKETSKVALMLEFVAMVFVLVSLKYLTLAMFLEYFTMNMHLRKESTDRAETRSTTVDQNSRSSSSTNETR